MDAGVEVAEFFTQQYRIVGTVRTGGQRLTDILNDELASSIELRDVQVTRLLSPKKGIASYTSATLEKQSILFAISGKESDRAAERRLYKHVATREWDVFLTVPWFELTGKLHVRGTGELKTVLVAWTRRFMPLTQARAVFTLLPNTSFTGEAIIVNRGLVQIICTDPKSAV
ncbi:MAG: hypothetical protein GTO63_20775 [Anaerolineae bacterium]|nr:hypothetical protein [Anaerolineae bacterium]NIN97214.1 hypothetical protein [Anaerolineae bacterium]NIQ80167.1 hypothetical protein [Anaerolineae bacterium]